MDDKKKETTSSGNQKSRQLLGCDNLNITSRKNRKVHIWHGGGGAKPKVVKKKNDQVGGKRDLHAPVRQTQRTKRAGMGSFCKKKEKSVGEPGGGKKDFTRMGLDKRLHNTGKGDYQRKGVNYASDPGARNNWKHASQQEKKKENEKKVGGIRV